MSDIPDYLERGERARLFPVLAETSKEGRTTAVFLSCLANVYEFGQALLGSLGQRIGSRANIEAYTEVVFRKGDTGKGNRPDGLIVVTIGSRTWKALVEAKVGNAELTTEQIENYLEIAAANGIDAVVTVSNQFAATPGHHPVAVRGKLTNKVQLFHWSWMYVLTEADLLTQQENVEDADQHYILTELNRFLVHPSAGVKGFDRMPAAWGDLNSTIAAGGEFGARSAEAEQVVGAWHQEVRDLSLILTRIVGVQVTPRIARAHISDHAARMKSDVAKLAEDKHLSASLAIPDAAGALDVSVNVARRTISARMKLRAPEDKQSTKARLNWLLRQLRDVRTDDVYIRLHWPGRGTHTQHALTDLQVDPDIAVRERPSVNVHAFEVCLVRRTGKRFAQSKNFITDIEELVPDFYEIAQNLKAWQRSAPRMREDRSEPTDVTPNAMYRDSEGVTLDVGD